jgi:hypothetical protein
MKKGLKSCLIAILALAGLCIVGVVVMFATGLCPPAGPWPMPPWCQTSGQTGPSLPGLTGNSPIAEPSLTFTVTVPPNTPPHTVVYLGLYDEDGNLYQFPKMERVSDNVWRLSSSEYYQQLQTRDVLRYKYNRDQLAYMTDEEFAPDSPDTYRTITLGDSPEINDVVKKWRWLPEPGAVTPTVDAHVIPLKPRVDGYAFQSGVLMADFWWTPFDNLIESTDQRLAEHHVKWVSISPTWNYTQTAPLPVIGNVGYTEEELANHLSRMKADGFEVYMAPQVCCDLPEKSALNDAWWEEWLKQYGTFLQYHVDMANHFDVQYFSTDPGYFVNDNIPPQYRKQLDALVDDAHARFKGNFGRSVYVGGNVAKDLYCAPIDNGDRWDYFSVSFWAGISTGFDPSLEELSANALKVFDRCLAPLYRKYHKPVILTQVAYPSVDGGLQGTTFLDGEDPAISLWEPYSDKFQLDLVEQAMGYDAIMNAVAKSDYIIGVYPFVYFPETLPVTLEYNIRDKPAEEVLSQWYESIP